MIPDSRFVQSPDDAQLLPGLCYVWVQFGLSASLNPSSAAGACVVDAELLEAWRDHPLERLKDWVNLLTLSSELCFRALGKRPYGLRCWAPWA